MEPILRQVRRVPIAQLAEHLGATYLRSLASPGVQVEMDLCTYS